MTLHYFTLHYLTLSLTDTLTQTFTLTIYTLHLAPGTWHLASYVYVYVDVDVDVDVDVYVT